MPRWTLFTGILAITSFLISARGANQPRANVSPAYRIDLKKVVKGPFAFIPVGPGGESRVGLPIRSLRFLDNERLAATVVTQAPGVPALPTRGYPSIASRFRLHVVLLDAATGKILSTPTWPSNTRYAWIIAATRAGFVVETGNVFSLVSPGLKTLKQLKLPDPGADRYGHELWWVADPSWSEKYAVLLRPPFGSIGLWLWIDTENLKTLKSWHDNLSGPVTASDNQLVKMVFQQHAGSSPSHLEISAVGGSWKPLPTTINASSWQFVNQGLLYVQSDGTGDAKVQGGVFLMNTDTEELSRLEPPRKGWGLGQAAVSRSGKRFVILVEQTKGAHPALDIGGHGVLRELFVFDPPFKAPSFTLEVHGSKIRNPDNVALSPDGRHLAVFANPDPVFEVYELPPPK